MIDLLSTPRRWSAVGELFLHDLGEVPAVVRKFIALALEAAPSDSVERLALTLDVPHRTLNRHVSAAGFRSPHEILRVCRLLKAAFMLIFERLSVERTAERTGFGRSGTLRRHLVETFGVLPRELRSPAGAVKWPAILGEAINALRRSVPVLLLLGVWGSSVAGQQPRATIGGRVTDAVAGGPLANATVSLEGTLLTVTTDEQGRFRLAGAPPGPKVLRAIRIGYAPLRRPITVPPSGDLVVDLALAKSALNLPNLVVTADPVATDARNTTAPATIKPAIQPETFFRRPDTLSRKG